jgi:DinB family protein
MPIPAPRGLAPEIDEFRRGFESLADEADRLASELTDAQFAWAPAGKPSRGTPRFGWSVAQCIDHLNVTARQYLPQLDEGIANAIRQGSYGKGPFTYSWLSRMFVRIIEPPVRFRIRTPALFEPPPARSRREIMAAFRAYQVQYIDRLRQANGLDLARAKARSPAASWLHLPLGSAFAATIAHERRHLWQARLVTEAPGFPRG